MLYNAAVAPKRGIKIVGANHSDPQDPVSFTSLITCGAVNSTRQTLYRRYMAGWFEYYLRNDARYGPWVFNLSGDKLCAQSPRLALVRTLANERKFFHWELEFIDLFARRGGIDLILFPSTFIIPPSSLPPQADTIISTHDRCIHRRSSPLRRNGQGAAGACHDCIREI